jgi:hypothetical protein
MKGSWPIGKNQLRALGHRQFLANVTGLYKPGKWKPSKTANHTLYTCVKGHRESA